MNRIMNSTMKRSSFLLMALVVAGLLLVPSAQTVAAPGVGWLSLTNTIDKTSCVFTVTVGWAGFSGGSDTLEVYLTENRVRIAPAAYLYPVKGKNGTATVTLALATDSGSSNYFYAWAQLLDSHGNAIPGSLDFASQDVASCTAP